MSDELWMRPVLRVRDVEASVASSVLSLTCQPDKLGALYRELKERGAKVVAPPFAVVWQKDTYELDVEDLDGNILAFWGDAPK